MFIYYRQKLASLKFLTAKFLVQRHRVLLILYLHTTRSGRINNITTIEEFNDKGSDIVFHA